LWSSEQRHAKFEADTLHQYAQQLSIEDWLYNIPMTQVRQWRNTFLPNRAKRGRKIFILWELRDLPEFRAECRRAFEAWQEEQAAEVGRLMAIAKQQPVARHLEWLAVLTRQRLDAHHSLTNSCGGPETYGEYVEAWVEHLQSGAKGDLTGIDQEIAEATSMFASIYDPDVMEIAKEVAWSAIKATEAAVTSPAALKRALLEHRPTQLVPTRCCQACERLAARRPARKSSRKGLAPFHLLCTCGSLRWRPANYSGGETHWQVGANLDARLQQWAIARHLGISSVPTEFSGLLSKASTISFDRRWNAKQSAQLQESRVKRENARG
jgi:hypothetical protein